MLRSNDSLTVTKPENKKISAQQTGYFNSKKKYLQTKVMQVFHIRCAKLWDIIMRDILRKKCYINICSIITRYTTTCFLMYVHGCNQKFTVHMFVTLYKKRKKEICVSDNIIKETHQLSICCLLDNFIKSLIQSEDFSGH
jgi:hypothetical protein